jgi:MFS family permease
LFALAGGLAASFFWVERRTASPVVDLALFASRSFSGGIGAAVLQFMGLSAVVILMPFYLLDARGFSLLETGGIMAALPLAMLVFSPSSGMLSDRFGVRVLTTLGLAMVSAGLLMMATIDVETSVVGIVLRLIVIGIGTAVFQSPNTSSIMGSVGPERLGTASAAATTARTIGNSIGIATAGALFTAQATSYALARSELGLDDPLVAPDALVSGLRLAAIAAAAVTAAGIAMSWSRGDRVGAADTPVVTKAAGVDSSGD